MGKKTIKKKNQNLNSAAGGVDAFVCGLGQADPSRTKEMSNVSLQDLEEVSRQMGMEMSLQ